MEKLPNFLLLLSTFLHAFSSTSSQPFIGINYGELSDNLPSPESTARLLQSTTISRLRLFSPNPSLIRSLSINNNNNSNNISLILTAPNSLIPSLSSSPSAASAWLSSNLLPFPSISTLSVGNEVLTASAAADPSLSSNLLSAMQNLRSAIPPGIHLKISTVHSMSLLSRSDPPSSAAFRSDLAPLLTPILRFLRDNDSPFLINPYPYFAYQSDPRAETLAFCLFQPNSGRPDPGSGVTYTNMFDAQVAAVRAALAAAGFAGAEVVVAETGWPYNGDATEAGATVENARAYNGNLLAHLRAMKEPLETYIFALYDEDLKPGPTSERSFGLFRTDLTPIYDVGLLKSGRGEVAPSPAPVTELPATEPPAPAVAEGCVPGSGAATCGQPAVQNLPRNSDESVGRRRRRRRWKDMCWMVGVWDFAFYVALAVLVMR